MLLITRQLIIFLLCLLPMQILAGEHIPVINAAESAFDGELSLSGEWALVRGGWPTLKDIQHGYYQSENIRVPGPLNAVNNPNEDYNSNEGYNTYLLRLNNLNQNFVQPAIRITELREAWRAWWIDDTGTFNFLGESGKIAKTPADQKHQTHPYLLEFPPESSSGVLVIYQSGYYLYKTGILNALSITEKNQALRSILTDLAARFLFFGVGLFVVIQNLVFFAQRPKEKVLLILAAFAVAALARSVLSSGYVDYFVNYSGFFFYSIRIEYALIIIPGVIALYLMLSMFPVKHNKAILYAGYLVLGLTILVTCYLSISQMTRNLPAYQAVVFVTALACIGLIGNGIIKNATNAKSFGLSFTPVIVALINDIIATRTPDYSFYCVEYAIFIFLFIQTQIQASRFVSALDTAEHLTAHLHEEVQLKTNELSRQNHLLKEKTTDLEKQHDQIKLLSETDHLTGLFNRQTLEDHASLMIRMAKAYNQPLTLVMMDLDHFKQINDQYGHMVGDECLIFTASFLRGYKLRKRDFIARFGGEEFVLILNDTNLEAAQEIIQQLCTDLANQPVTGDHPNIYMTASFGIAELHTSGAGNLKDLIRSADLALYRAKQNGRNCVESHRSNGGTIKL